MLMIIIIINKVRSLVSEGFSSAILQHTNTLLRLLAVSKLQQKQAWYVLSTTQARFKSLTNQIPSYCLNSPAIEDIQIQNTDQFPHFAISSI